MSHARRKRKDTETKPGTEPEEGGTSLPGGGPGADLPGTSEDDDFLDGVISGLPNGGARIIEALTRAKAVYVPCGRDRLLKKTFDKFVQEILTKRDSRRDEGRCFFITGESGAGKSALVRNLLKQYPTLQPSQRTFGPVSPIISITLQGPCILKTLGRKILDASGYPLKQNLQENQIWEMLPRQLHHRKVLLIHIDEPQHMLTNTERDQERKNVAKAFKGVMNDREWPVSFILSGMPETSELARKDEQIERRGYQFHLSDVAMPAERKLVERIVSDMAGAVGIDVAAILESDLPERTAHAAAYRYGRISQVALAALHTALVDGASVLTREHFALAYLEHSHARGQDDMNPFLVADWQRLEPGSFLIETPK